MIKVAVIGLGRMGKLHMMNCLHMDDVKVVSAADQSKKALGSASSIGVKNLYTDYHDMLREHTNFDTVIICLPNCLHFESIQLALEAELDVFVEKPLATTVEECGRIVKLVNASGRKLTIGHSSRFLDAIEKMKAITDMGKIGDLQTLTMEEVINGPFAHAAVPKPVPEWWFDTKKTGGGVLLDLGYHMIDLFRFLTGKECKVLFSSLGYKFNLPFEDEAIVVLQSTDDSTKAIVNVGWYQRLIFPQFNFRTIIHGDAGYLSTDEFLPRNMYLHAVKEGTKNLFRRFVGKEIETLSYTYYFTAYYKEMKRFFTCIKNDSEPAVSAVDGLKTIEAVVEAYKRSRHAK